MNRITAIVRSHLHGSFHEVDAFGTFVNEPDNSKKTITPGGVYGFFVKLSADEVDLLFAEARSKNTLAINLRANFKPLVENIYPLYWGKDKSLGSRINAHIKNPDGRAQGKTGTGLVRLCAYSTLHGKEIGVVAVTVSDYSAFERHIRSIYPDLLKTKSTKI
ncbi:MAG TPA: hypothetical protein VK165_18405 [Azonexus sp.]|nr:hypothetical protein [Azonexus sp.]